MKRTLIFLIALFMAGMTTYFFHTYTQTLKPRAATVSGQMVSVVIAKDAIKKNTQITDQMVAVEQVPKSSLQPDAVRNIADAAGKVALVDIQPNEMILSHHIVSTNDAHVLSYKVQPGFRAITVTAKILGDTVANLIEPGDKVDVVFSIKGQTTVLLNDIKVLAVDQRMQQTSGNEPYKPYTMTTLEVKPEDALKIIDSEQKIVLNDNKGTLTLILRSAIQTSKEE